MSITLLAKRGKVARSLTGEAAPSGTPGSTAIVDSVTRLPVDAAALTTSGAGSTLQLDAITYDSGNGEEMIGVVLAWTSSNAGVATVGASTGLVTGVGAGTTNIGVTATKNSVSATDSTPAAITVSPAAVASVATSASSVSCTDTGTTTFSVQPKDASGANLAGRTVTVDTNNHAIATASIVGYTVTVTGVAAGSCTVTATCETIPSSGVTATVTAASTSHPSEPAGFTVETDHSWANGKTADGWTVDPGYNASAFILTTSIPEGTPTYGESTVCAARYPANGVVPASYGGVAPLYTSYVPTLKYDRKYYEFGVMIPTGWVGDPTASVNKLFFIEVKGSGGTNLFPIYFNIKCNGSGGAGFQVKNQGCPPSVGGNTSSGDGQFPSAIGTVPLTRGVFAKIGVELQLNTWVATASPGVGDDGIVKIYKDDVLKYSTTTWCVRAGNATTGYATTANHQLRGLIFNPTRGGAAATMTAVQYIYIVRPYMSRF